MNTQMWWQTISQAPLSEEKLLLCIQSLNTTSSYLLVALRGKSYSSLPAASLCQAFVLSWPAVLLSCSPSLLGKREGLQRADLAGGSCTWDSSRDWLKVIEPPMPSVGLMRWYSILYRKTLTTLTAFSIACLQTNAEVCMIHQGFFL